MEVLKAIHRIGSLPDDDGITLTRKQFLDYQALGTSIGAILIGSLLSILSLNAAIATLCFVPLTLLNYAFYHWFKSFVVARNVQTALSVTNALMVQCLLGGFEASGAAMLWSLTAMIVALPYHDIKESTIWSCIYILLCGLTFWMDAYFVAQFQGTVSPNVTRILLVVNLLAVFGQILFLYIRFIQINFQNTEQVRITYKQMLFSEKLATLGQLSAGIAHDVNTPLGAIKSSQEESSLAFAEMLDDLQWMETNLDPSQRQLFLAMIAVGNPQGSSLSTKEEREIRRKMKTRLDLLGVGDSNLICDRLVQVGIQDVGPELEALAQSPGFERLILIAYHILIQRKSGQTIQLAAEKAGNILKALKTYLHTSETGPMEQLNIRDNIETALTIYGNRLKHGIQVIKNYEAVPLITGYPDQLNQVWTNLIVNAIQAMNGTGILTIGLGTEDNHVVVSIQDNGKGIPDAIKAKIFDPFFTTKVAGEGSGLGLDIIKRILDQHQATITFDSTVGIGTTFFIRFPMRKAS